MDELILTGYCRLLDGNRVLCCEKEEENWQTDCRFPDCEFALSCVLISKMERIIAELG